MSAVHARRRELLCAFVAWMAFSCLVAPACAIDTSLSLAMLERTPFHSREGAPGDIQAAAQASDGTLWLGTSAGLYEFDGISFRPYQPSGSQRLPDLNITALVAAPEGGLWVATRFGHVYFISQKSIRVFGQTDGLPEHTLSCLAIDAAGQVWGGSMVGIFHLVQDRWVLVRNSDGSLPSAAGFDCLKVDRHGNLWIHDVRHLSVLRPNSDRVTVLRSIESGEGIFVDRQGEAWLSDSRGFFSLSDDRIGIPLAQLPGSSKSTSDHSFVYFIDSANTAWGLTAKGGTFRVSLPRIVHDGAQAPPSVAVAASAEGLPHIDVAIRPFWVEDVEGNIWITSSSGIDRFRTTKFHRVTIGGGAVGAGGLAISRAGVLWTESEAGVFRRGVGEEFTKVDIGDSFRCPNCSLFATRDGILYRGRRVDLERLGRAGFERASQPPDGTLGAGGYHSIAEDDEGGLWVSVTRGQGVFSLRGGRWTRRDGSGGLPSETALSMTSDGDRLWLGYLHGRLAIVRSGFTRMLGEKDGLAIGDVLTVAGQGPTAWLAGKNGLAYFDGDKVHTVVARRGPWMGVSGLVLTPEGDLWLNDEGGVQRIPKEELTAFLNDPTHKVVDDAFDVHAGVEGTPAQFEPIPTAARTPDGLLWFSTSAGLFSIDPRKISRNRVAPQVTILDVRSNGALFSGGSVRLPPGSSAIEISYSAPVLAVPELARFKYRLEGVDAAWQDAGDRRKAFYTNLSPGNYRFQVMAANEDGVWSEHAAEMLVEIAPSYWQTIWFRAIMAVLATLLVVAGVLMWHHIRVRRLSRALRLEAGIQHSERERIARDLHDTLLQNMYGFVWRMDVIARRFPAGDENRTEMSEALDRAEKALGAGRERMFSPQGPVNDDGRTLVERLSDLARTWSADTGIGFRVDVRDEKPLRAGTVPLLERILSEAIVNAFRHSGASTVTLTLRFDPDQLRCSVSDDGKGVPLEFVEKPPEGHLGLRLMRDRSATIGARLVIRRLETGGSAIDLALPARKAYVRPPFGRRLVAGLRSVRQPRGVAPWPRDAETSSDS